MRQIVSINPETFDGQTVELTLFGETRRVKAKKTEEFGWLHAYGIEGMYRTGKKWWPGSVRLDANGRYNIRFGRFDNHPKFCKTNIRFAKAGL